MKALELILQDPGGRSLRDRLLEASAGADRGGAIFAWTNATGSKEILEDPAFLEFIKGAPFDLIVGTDSITDESAVDVLIAAEAASANLTVHAFVHNTGNLFHPKLAWFGRGTRLVLLIGSGNLTMGGLTNNWEAFAIVTLSGAAAADVEKQLKDWRKTWSAVLLPVADPDVRTRAAQNRGQERDFKRLRRRLVTKTKDLDPSLDALVAEVSRSRGGWTQVNFHKSHFQQFFGADLDALPRFIRTREVLGDGRLGPVEQARGIRVASQNYRFEFAGPRGRVYPAAPPVGVHVRLGPDDFLYLFREPGQAGHAELDALLGARRGQTMRQKRFTVAEVLTAWASGPLGKVSADAAY